MSAAPTSPPSPTGLRRLLARSLPLTFVAYAAHDAFTGLRRLAGHLGSEGGAAHAGCDLDASVDYIERVVAGYRRLGGFERFDGVCAELGPGDSIGVARLMRSAGAAAVELIDRFDCISDPQQQAAIDARLAERNPGVRTEADPQIVRRTGQPAEHFFHDCVSRGQRYDRIVSQAVLEHLFDPLAALRDMVACLAPGGVMAHVVDLRDHGMFTPQHPLTFLKVPQRLYRAMTRHSGRPNRVLFADYRRCLEDCANAEGLSWSLYATHLVEAGPLAVPTLPGAIAPELLRTATRSVGGFLDRHRVDTRFRMMAPEDLAIDGCAIVVRRS